MCGLEIQHEDGRVLAIRGDRGDPLSQGHVCPKALALADLQEDPDRLRTPVVRTGSEWAPIGWDEALDRTAAGVSAARRRGGMHSVAYYQGTPTAHSYPALLFGRYFAESLATRNRYSWASIDHLPHLLVASEVFGSPYLLPVPDVDRTDFLLVFGANPVVSGGSLFSAPGAGRRLRALRRRGGRLVVVDPRRTETASLADLHLAIRPGTDALLLAALLHVLFAEGRVRVGRLGSHVDGLDLVSRAVTPFAPERVARAVGLDSAAIRSLAAELAAARSAACYGRLGTSTQSFGALSTWMLLVLNLVTGNLDRPGGAMFSTPAVDVPRLARWLGPRADPGRSRSGVRGLPSFAGELPVSALAEEIECDRPDRVRALLTFAGNPVLSAPNGGRLDRALAGLDFMASIDFYVNETTRHAHVILPPPTPLERDHYDLAFHLLSVRNTARYCGPLFPAAGGARHDWQIFLGLMDRLARDFRWPRRWGKRIFARSLAWLGPRGMLDLFLRLGPHRLSLARLAGAPHGVDLGALRPGLPRALRAPDRRIRAAPPRLLADLDRLEERLASADDGGLVLIGRRQLRDCNSWLHNSLRRVRGPDRCTLLIHPSDAVPRGISTGALVRVRSTTGSIEVAAEVSESIRPGVVCLPHGWGHDRPGVRLSVARGRPGASANDVTDDARVDAVCGVAAFSAQPVEVERLSGPKAGDSKSAMS